jgi:hypothetical protein
MLLAMAGMIASHLGAKLRDVETRIESCDFPKSGSGKYLSIRKQLVNYLSGNRDLLLLPGESKRTGYSTYGLTCLTPSFLS